MKTIFLFIGLTAMLATSAQDSGDLMVYSVKGNAFVIENNLQSKIKIGKALKKGMQIKTEDGAKLTMVCKSGRPLSLNKAGTYSLAKWKDSCSEDNSSLSSKYFRYVWDQMYVRTEDYKKLHPEATAAVVRSNPPVTNGPLEIFIDPAFDTIHYSNGSFPLSWEPSYDFKAKYYFTLVATKGNKTVYKDSLSTNQVDIAKLKKYMKAGAFYKWTVTAPGTIAEDGGIISYVAAQTVSKQVAALQKNIDVHEDVAAGYFRTAFLLQEKNYLPAALEYYEKAAKADTEFSLYQDRLQEFKKQFGITR